MPSHVECLVVGGGPVGLCAAASLTSFGLEVALAAAPPEASDTRTAAMFPPVVDMLRNLGAWTALEADSAPLLGIRIIDGTGRLMRAPEVTFRASEVGRSDLGYNVPNTALSVALAAAARRAGARLLDDGPVTALTIDGEAAKATLASGRALAARLVVGADGRSSLCRASAGIGLRRWSYKQAAVVARFEHSRPHRGISNELHRPAGPCTTVPLPGQASSLVWVEKPETAERLMAATPVAFASELADRLGGLLGEIKEVGPRRSFSLSGHVADMLAHNRVALVGEAGHLLPPIGAQGLNLGMFDVAVLADCAAAARAADSDIGAAEVLEDYANARAPDVRRRMAAVDVLNRSLTSGLPPIDLARGAGLHILAAAPGLRRRIMQQGLIPPGPLPRLMRPPQPATDGDGPAAR